LSKFFLSTNARSPERSPGGGVELGVGEAVTVGVGVAVAVAVGVGVTEPVTVGVGVGVAVAVGVGVGVGEPETLGVGVGVGVVVGEPVGPASAEPAVPMANPEARIQRAACIFITVSLSPDREPGWIVEAPKGGAAPA
jgi:hypothetical protein